MCVHTKYFDRTPIDREPGSFHPAIPSTADNISSLEQGTHLLKAGSKLLNGRHDRDLVHNKKRNGHSRYAFGFSLMKG